MWAVIVVTANVSSRALFNVPLWTAQVSSSTAWIPWLVRDIDRLLTAGGQDPDHSAGNQTLPDLQLRTEPHWVEFFGWVRDVFEAITLTAPVQRYQRFDLRAWALRVDSISAHKDLHCGPTRLLATHNHSPALLTSVFTCELPAEPPPVRLATVFHNPVFHVNCPWQPKIVPFTPVVGTLLTFPGWLEHSVPIAAPIPPGERRITINTDYFPDFG